MKELDISVADAERLIEADSVPVDTGSDTPVVIYNVLFVPKNYFIGHVWVLGFPINSRSPGIYLLSYASRTYTCAVNPNNWLL